MGSQCLPASFIHGIYQAAYNYTQVIAYMIFYPFLYLWSGSDFNGILRHKARTF